MADPIRLDHKVIRGIVEAGSKVLDLGCGDGDLSFILAREKNAKIQGIEIDEKSIYKCVAKGLSVFHSDIDSGLPEYPDKAFDYVILNQTLQQSKKVEYVMTEALRVGKKVIVGFPNFAHLGARCQLFFKGESPVTESLPYRWYNSPNIHFLSIKDFNDYCQKQHINIVERHYLGKSREVVLFPNLLATNAIFVLTH
jgi:methionine biosynthesis protein MetW